MNVIFVSNYINHHQLPVSRKLLELCQADGGNYYFIQTEPMEEERVKMGWGETLQIPDFVLDEQKEPEKCRQLILDADVVIFGGSEREEIIEERLQSGKPLWRYSESIYKTGRWKFVSPRGLKKKYHDHTRYGKERVYMLCAGAYVAGDFRLVRAYPGKKYKYGYFPECRKYDLEELWQKKEQSGKTELLWAARMIDWKHPEAAIALAKSLQEAGVDFRLTMLGDGPLRTSMEDMVKKLELENLVEFKGFCNPEVTREYMEKSHIYLATSDRQEGWGAVINESMNSGMVVVANHGMGAADYLIQDGVNGILYHSPKGSFPKEMAARVLSIISKKEDQIQMGTQAYRTITELWNAQEAASRLYVAMKAEWEGKTIPEYASGPLSREK